MLLRTQTSPVQIRAMLERGVYLAPSAFEAGFMSSAHDADVIAATLEAARGAFAELAAA